MNWVSERSIAMKCRSFHKALPGCLNGLVNKEILSNARGQQSHQTRELNH